MSLIQTAQVGRVVTLEPVCHKQCQVGKIDMTVMIQVGAHIVSCGYGLGTVCRIRPPAVYVQTSSSR